MCMGESMTHGRCGKERPGNGLFGWSQRTRKRYQHLPRVVTLIEYPQCCSGSFRILFSDSMFARSPAKSQSQNEQGSGSNAPAPPSAVLDNATAEELKNLLDRQRLEMEGPRARLEAQKIADQAVVPELNEATLQEF